MHILGHGIDAVSIARIKRMLDDHGDRFVERCFTKREQAYADSGRATRVERYAAGFAGKEAVLKALGTGLAQGTTWLDMSIEREPSGRPMVYLSGRCAEIAAQAGMTQWHISLTHTADLAMASVIACGEAAR